jgi:hypothetical protein
VIPANEMLDKMGKKKFVEMVTNSQKGETGAQRQQRRRFGKGKTCMAICVHGKVTVRNFEPTGECDSCSSSKSTKLPEFQPYFNAGLGGWVESRSDERQAARSLGLQEAG